MSAEFFANNDLNVTASCFHVNMATDKLFTVHASPCFWEFVFQESGARMIRTVKPFADGYEASTCIWIAYKAYQMKLDYSFGDINLTLGTLANSHKAKFDEMKNWVDNPFQEYQCNKCRNHFVLSKKHAKVGCKSCVSAWSNKSCSHGMCKKCCIEHTSGDDVSACKVKSHSR